MFSQERRCVETMGNKMLAGLSQLAGFICPLYLEKFLTHNVSQVCIAVKALLRSVLLG